MPQTAKRLLYIDSLRGISAIAVAYFHLLLYMKKFGLIKNYFDHYLAILITDFFGLGKIAILIFFMISGFVIPFSITKYRAHNMKRFIITRFFRLYPAYWLSILCFIIVMLYKNNVIDWNLILINLTMMQAFFMQSDLIGVFWTLQIELIFYFLCSMLFITNKLNNNKFIFYSSFFFLICALILSLFRYISGFKLPVALPLALSIMFFGMLWRNYIIDNDQTSKTLCYKIIFILFALLPIICLLAYNKDYGNNETWYRYVTSYYGAILLFILCTTSLKIQNVLTIFLGKISYSIYLLHPLLLLLLNKEICTTLLTHLPLQIILISSLAIIILCATLSFYLVENNALIIGKRIIKRYAKENQPN